METRVRLFQKCVREGELKAAQERLRENAYTNTAEVQGHIKFEVQDSENSFRRSNQFLALGKDFNR
jgi:hypothetical protein